MSKAGLENALRTDGDWLVSARPFATALWRAQREVHGQTAACFSLSLSDGRVSLFGRYGQWCRLFRVEGTLLRWADNCISEYVEYNPSFGLRAIVEADSGLFGMEVKIGDRTLIFRRLVYEDKGRESLPSGGSRSCTFRLRRHYTLARRGRTSHRQ